VKRWMAVESGRPEERDGHDEKMQVASAERQ
jgi:hypothetical protein